MQDITITPLPAEAYWEIWKGLDFMRAIMAPFNSQAGGAAIVGAIIVIGIVVASYNWSQSAAPPAFILALGSGLLLSAVSGFFASLALRIIVVVGTAIVYLTWRRLR